MAVPHWPAVRDVPERFGNWNTIYKNSNRLSEGVWARVLEKVQSLAHQRGELDWVASTDSTIVRVHQHGAIPSARHRGPGRTTRSSARNPLITRSVALVAA